VGEVTSGGRGRAPLTIFETGSTPLLRPRQGLLTFTGARRNEILFYDEIDAVFDSAKVQEANLDLRSVLNGGYRRGTKVPRCKSKTFELEELTRSRRWRFGLRELPDTLASRSIFIRMKRRAPDEQVASHSGGRLPEVGGGFNVKLDMVLLTLFKTA
jgi:hypothetical protein